MLENQQSAEELHKPNISQLKNKRNYILLLKITLGVLI